MPLASLAKLFPSASEKAVGRHMKMAKTILGDLPKLAKTLADNLPAATRIVRTNAEKKQPFLVQALATGTEAIRLETGITLHPEQIVGAAILAQGGIAELKTGEGKTLVAILAAYVESLSGPVHVVTVNDYLVTRDAALAERVLARLGVTVGHIVATSTHEERVAAYAKDVTYVTGSELGFDLLRDSIVPDLSLIVAPTRRSAIVDEVDSLLIDEARTPIIISETTSAMAPMVKAVHDVVEAIPADGFEIDPKEGIAMPTERTWGELEDALRTVALLAPDASLQSDEARAIAHRVEQAIRARFGIRRDKDFIVRGDRVFLVDQNTGQISDGRSYADGLQQAIEVRVGLPQSPESSTVASVSYQSLFRLYGKLAGLTGTAASDAKEFVTVYGIDTHVVPTHRPVVREDRQDEIYTSEREKTEAVVAEIVEAHFRLQPVLVGSRSIEKCEDVARALEAAGFLRIPANDPDEVERAVKAALEGQARRVFRVLDAKDPEFEAAIVAQAGLPGAITVATTIAGRGTDVKLGGDVEFRLTGADDARRETITEETKRLGRTARERGGLYVIGTERLDNRRMDDQFRGRSGRQGDPGASKFFLCLSDDILKNHEGVAKVVKMAKMKEGEALSARIVDKAVAAAQQAREALHYQMRSTLLKMDEVIEEQRRLFSEIRKEAITCVDVDEWVREMMDVVVDDLVDRHVPRNQVVDLWAYTAIEDEYANTTMIKVPVRDLIEKREIRDPDTLAAHLKGIVKEVHGSRREAAPESHDAIVAKIVLHCLDTMWRRHVEGVEYMRKGLFLRDGTRDGGPLATYRVDAARSFEAMLMEWRRQTVRSVRSLKLVGTAATSKPASIEKAA